MANPQLLAYIKENYPKFPKETVLQTLQSAGWSAVDVSAAFMEIEHPVPVIAEPAQQRPIGSVEPRPAVASAPARPAGGFAPVSTNTANPNTAFLAEMEKRRKEANMLNPETFTQGNVTISVGAVRSQQTIVTQGGLTGMLMKTGLVKDEQQANVVLVCVVVVCVALGVWFVWPSGGGSGSAKITIPPVTTAPGSPRP